MVVRVLPSSRSDVYSNTGSAGQLVKYLEHEAREEKREDRAIFFNQSQDGIKGEVVQQHLDTNVKGLRAKEARFHSIVIAPSQDELAHIKGDAEKLKQYTRQVMENYASNFHSRTGKTLTSNDLVWYATVHTSRRHRNQDEEVLSGRARNRQEKEGPQTHIHVVVSARDKNMRRTLHPDSGPKQFNYRAWLQHNNRDFAQQFGYQKTITEEEQRARLDKQLNRIDRTGLLLDRNAVATVGQQQGYGSHFWQTLNRIEREAKKGSIYTPNQAYERLQASNNPDRLEKQLNQLDRLGLPLDQNRVSRAAKQQRYSPEFWRTLDELQKEVRQGQPPPAKQVYARFAGNGESVKNRSRGSSGQTSGQPQPATKHNDKAPLSSGPAQPNAGKQNLFRSTNQPASAPRPVNLKPLLAALSFESLPQGGGQAKSQDDYKRKRRRRR